MNPRLLIATVSISVMLFIAGLAINVARPDPDAIVAFNNDDAGEESFLEADYILVARSDDDIPLAPPLMQKNQSAQLLSYINYYGGDIEQVYEKFVSTSRGDTLIKMLQDKQVDRIEAHLALVALSKVWNPRELQLGQTISVIFQHGDKPENRRFLGFYTRPDVEQEVVLYRDAEDGSFKVEKIVREMEKREVLAENVIQSSLFEAGNAANVPVGTLVEMIRVFSYDVDFQRDIREGDSFTLFYEAYYDPEGHFARAGRIQFAEMNLSGKERGIYYFKPATEPADFFDKSGQSVRRELLRTPVDGARLSSGFGMRRHPILGYSRMHRGVDFAAPTGTPIRAAGNGVVEVRKYWGAFGNYIRIKHNNTYSTAYAHLHRFATGLKVGNRVRQGEIIGYVGTTGRSTGPHLHYEVHRNGQQVNPLSVNLPTGTTLRGKDLENFKKHISLVDERMSSQREKNILLAQKTNVENVEDEALPIIDEDITQN